MISRTPACLSGILGGACLIARYALDRLDVVAPGGQTGTALRWAGLTWLALALFAAGAGLTARSAVVLRVLVALCVVLLGTVVLSLLYPGLGRLLGDAAFGGAAALVSVVVWFRGGGRDRADHPPAHAAD